MKYLSMSLLLSAVFRLLEWFLTLAAAGNGSTLSILYFGLSTVSSLLLVASVAYPMPLTRAVKVAVAGVGLSWITTGPYVVVAMTEVARGTASTIHVLLLVPAIPLSWATAWVIWAISTGWADKGNEGEASLGREP